MNAHFLTSESNQKKNNFYNNFFREVCNDEYDKDYNDDDDDDAIGINVIILIFLHRSGIRKQK